MLRYLIDYYQYIYHCRNTSKTPLRAVIHNTINNSDLKAATNQKFVFTTEKSIVYVRISSVQQRMDSQEDELRRWIEHHQSAKVRWYRDKYTGKSMKRPAMDRLLTDLHKDRLKNVVIFSLCRLGRTASGLTQLFEILQKYRCNLISLRDHLDLSTPSGRLNANIIASVAMYEAEIRAERVKAGQASAKASGKSWGGSKKGLKKKTKAKTKAVMALVEQGVSKAEISRIVGVSIPTIYSIIRNS